MLALILKFLLRYARPFVPYYVVGAVMLVATNYAVVRIPALIGSALDVIGQGGGTVALSTSRSLAVELMAWALLLIVVRTLSRTLFFNPGRDIQFRLAVDLFGHLLTLPRPFYVRRKVGELVSIATNDTQSVRLLVGFAGLQVCNVAVAIPMHVAQMWATDATLMVWCATLVLVGGVHMIWTVRRFYGKVRDSLQRLAELSDRVLESYSGVGTIRSHAAEQAAVRRFDVRNRRYLELALDIARIRSFSMPILGFSGLAATGLVLWVGGRRVVAGHMSVGELATFVALLVSLVAILTSLAWVLTAISRGTVALGRVQGLLDEPSPPSSPGRNPAVAAPRRSPRLELRNLSFTHPGADAPSLNGLSATVEPGGTLGIFGKTGSGKTTLIELLARIYEPPNGTILLSDVDVTTVPTELYRQQLAVVPQDPFLFSTTLRDNIRMCGDSTGHVDRGRTGEETRFSRWLYRSDPAIRRDASSADRRLDAVLDAACMRPDVALLSEGLDTIVGERGVMLSGGQRQRAALARALYRGPAVLLLDDVLSAVDQQTEARLVDAIRSLGEGEMRPTTVIVSHRTSVLEHADEILVLDEGQVVARGRHADLAESSGVYADAHAHQAEVHDA